jgi:hypothetical protein
MSETSGTDPENPSDAQARFQPISTFKDNIDVFSYGANVLSLEDIIDNEPKIQLFKGTQSCSYCNDLLYINSPTDTLLHLMDAHRYLLSCNFSCPSCMGAMIFDKDSFLDHFERQHSQTLSLMIVLNETALHTRLQHGHILSMFLRVAISAGMSYDIQKDEELYYASPIGGYTSGSPGHLAKQIIAMQNSELRDAYQESRKWMGHYHPEDIQLAQQAQLQQRHRQPHQQPTSPPSISITLAGAQRSVSFARTPRVPDIVSANNQHQERIINRIESQINIPIPENQQHQHTNYPSNRSVAQIAPQTRDLRMSSTNTEKTETATPQENRDQRRRDASAKRAPTFTTTGTIMQQTVSNSSSNVDSYEKTKSSENYDESKIWTRYEPENPPKYYQEIQYTPQQPSVSIHQTIGPRTPVQPAISPAMPRSSTASQIAQSSNRDPALSGAIPKKPVVPQPMGNKEVRQAEIYLPQFECLTPMPSVNTPEPIIDMDEIEQLLNTPEPVFQELQNESMSQE